MSENAEQMAICAACFLPQLTSGLTAQRVYEIGECFQCHGPLAVYDKNRLTAFRIVAMKSAGRIVDGGEL